MANLSPFLFGHSLPPFSGEGFVHVLLRAWLPPPHETLQGEYLVHIDHPPCAKKINEDDATKNVVVE